MPFFRFFGWVGVHLQWAVTFFPTFFCFQTLRITKDQMRTFPVLFSIRSALKIDFRRSKRIFGGPRDSGEILVRFWWEMWEARYMMARLGWADIFFRSSFCIQTLWFWKDQMHTFLVLFSIRSTLKIDFRRSGRRLGGQIGGHPPFWRGFFGRKWLKIQCLHVSGGSPPA